MHFLKRFFVISVLFLVFLSCKSGDFRASKSALALKNNYLQGTSMAYYDKIDDTTFVNLKNFSSDFIYDMKYATEANFLKSKVYDCAQCYLRFKTIKKLIEANVEFRKNGYSIKIFDCYRPLDIQKKMWDLVPNADYVADPKRGSIHNRGGAVDITLVDVTGKELDMGTTFDFFGIEASHNYQNLSDTIKKNRLILKETMLKYNFKIFQSEWWHYNLIDSQQDKIANFKWNCN